MTHRHKQIQKQLAALRRQADKLREQDVGGVVACIKDAIAHYGLTAEQLGFSATSGPAKAKVKVTKSTPVRSAKYSDGQGNTWSGMGKRPYWLRDALAAGRSLEEFAASGLSTKGAPPSSKTKGKLKGKRKAKRQYQDQNGNSWSGMGPQPRWLKEALATGATIEQFAK